MNGLKVAAGASRLLLLLVGLPPTGSTRVSAAVAAPAAPLPKPVETWSIGVRSNNCSENPREVVRKVVNQKGPTLDVQVREIKCISSGGAVLRTPSVAERKEIVANTNFVEVGLNAPAHVKLGPRVHFLSVHLKISRIS